MVMKSLRTNNVFGGAPYYRDRRDAGERMAGAVPEGDRGRMLILGVPRGGVLVAEAMAHTLGVPFDVVMAHKLGAPGNPEVAIGAVSAGGAVFFHPYAGSYHAFDNFDEEKSRQIQVMQQREKVYRGVLPKQILAGKRVVVTDDGAAMGYTLLAALSDVREGRPAKLTAVLPIASRDAVELIRRAADEVICGGAPDPFVSVSGYYGDFRPVSDEEVVKILRTEAERQSLARRMRCSKVAVGGNH